MTETPHSVEPSVRGKYVDMDLDARAVAMADDCVGDPWELLGYFREKLRHAQADAESARDAATKLALRLRDARLSQPATSREAVAQAGKMMVDDYQVSEKHHPNHVLVPLSAFEAMRAALVQPEPSAGEAEAPKRPKCSCMEVYGEDPHCIKHGRGTEWHRKNPDICALAEKAAAYDAMLAASPTPADVRPTPSPSAGEVCVDSSVDTPPDEDWLADVIDDSLDMDWTSRVGARAIIAAWGKRYER